MRDMVSVVFLAIYRPSYFYGIQRCSYGSVSDCMKMDLKVQSVEFRYDLSEHLWRYEQFASCAIFFIAIGLQKCSGVDFKNTIQPNLYGSRF